eukprot:CCRYP_006758-RA/>CCRYP_006758-RA protein AED:0.42 eAED:0.42 QI:0/-1/0/1/-1/1/1/0/290
MFHLQLKHIPSTHLYVSEPSPHFFGNPPNEPQNPHWDSRTSNWLQSRFHFSFAEYSNSKNLDFGTIRVMNDDFVQPDRGFGTHGHANMEIVTYVVEGTLTHKDSMGTEESLGRGSVQFMTAGTGVRHSEFNLDKERGLRFIQTWILPRRRGLNPNYGSFDPSHGGTAEVCTSRNEWRHLVSDAQNAAVKTPVEIEQDANLFVAELDRGQSISFIANHDRMAYILCVEGTVNVSSGAYEVKMDRHDGCEVTPVASSYASSKDLVFRAGDEASAHVLVFEMEHIQGAGRKDI